VGIQPFSAATGSKSSMSSKKRKTRKGNEHERFLLAPVEHQIDSVEEALFNTRKFLEGLGADTDELHRRVEEIRFSYERELDRLRAKKDS
jgi:hypothetical protein